MKNSRNTSLSVLLLLAFTLTATTFSFSSCNSEPVPESPVMDEATFANFLEEAYFLEGFYSLETHYHFDTLQPEMIASYDSLMAKYGITHDIFDTTIHWYVHHPEIYLRVQDTVMARLTPSEEPTEEPEQDSPEEPEVLE